MIKYAEMNNVMNIEKIVRFFNEEIVFKKEFDENYQFLIFIEIKDKHFGDSKILFNTQRLIVKN